MQFRNIKYSPEIWTDRKMEHYPEDKKGLVTKARWDCG